MGAEALNGPSGESGSRERSWYGREMLRYQFDGACTSSSAARTARPAGRSALTRSTGAAGIVVASTVTGVVAGGFTPEVVAVEAVQTVVCSGTAGSFSLSHGGVVTAPIPFDADAPTVQLRLNVTHAQSSRLELDQDHTRRGSSGDPERVDNVRK